MKHLKKLHLSKKALIILISTICVVVIGAGVTVAFLSSLSGPLENVFTIGNIGLELNETTSNSYQLIPGKAHGKDPKVTVNGESEACWLFVKVVESQSFDDYITYEIKEGWTHLGGHDGVYYRSVESSESNQEFYILKDNKVTVRDDLTEEKASAITTPPTLTFSAYAVQMHSVETAADAWALLVKEGVA